MRRLILLLVGTAAVGCSANEESFSESVTRIGCQYERKCSNEDWEYPSVRACVKDRFDEELDMFTDFCGADDYDAEAARRCLRALRKNRRACGDAYDEVDELTETCSQVCGFSVGIGIHGIGPVFES